MTVEASTAGHAQAKLAWRLGVVFAQMNRIFLLILLVALVLFGAGALLLGAFPPSPHVQPVEKVLPNDQFKSG
jgi:hypothetical protein